MQEKMHGLQAEIAETTASGQAGGGVVSVTLKGTGELVAVELDPSLLKADEKDILEDSSSPPMPMPSASSTP